MQPCIAPELTNNKLPSKGKTKLDRSSVLGLIPEWHEVNRGEGAPACGGWNHLSHHCLPQVVPRGLEPRTLRLLAARSDQLSYETS